MPEKPSGALAEDAGPRERVAGQREPLTLTTLDSGTLNGESSLRGKAPLS